MTPKNTQLKKDGTARLRDISGELWNQGVKTISADFQDIIADDMRSCSSGKEYNIWSLCTLPKDVHEKVPWDISDLEILTAIFFFMFWIFVLLSLWHFSLWERRETGLCDIYSFIFLYRGAYMLVAIFALWSYMRYKVAMQGTLVTIWQSLLGYILIVGLDACAWYFLDNQKSPGSKLRWLMSINLVLALSPLIIGHIVHYARILRKRCSTFEDKECHRGAGVLRVLTLVIMYPLKIFKKPTDRTIVKALGSEERNLVLTGLAILLITAVFFTFIFCNFFYNFYTTLSDSKKGFKNALVLGFSVIMAPWGWLLRRIGRINDTFKFKPEHNEPKVWERHQTLQAFINAFNSKPETNQNLISICDVSFLLTQQKWYHRLPTCIHCCFSGSTLEESSNKDLVKQITKIKDDIWRTTSTETFLAMNQAPEQQADDRDSGRETADNPQEVKSADELDEPVPSGPSVEVLDDAQIQIYEREDGSSKSLTFATVEEENEEDVKLKQFWSTSHHLLKTLTPEELVCSLKDDLLRSGGYDNNLGLKAAEFYFGMFYRTLYYSLFAKIDDMMVIVGFEVINFLTSFVVCFLRMSHMYYYQSNKLMRKLSSKWAPAVINKKEEEKWKNELSVRWILQSFAEVLCLADFVISTTVLRYRYPNNDFIPIQDMGGNHEGYITYERYMVVMRFVVVILGFQVFHIVTMLLLFKRFYKLKLRTYLHFLCISKYYRFIIFFGGLHVLQDMHILRQKLELSKF